MSNDLWTWTAPDGTQHRATLDELRAALVSGTLAPDTQVRSENRGVWCAASEIGDVASAGASIRAPIADVPPPPLAVVAVQRAFESKASESFAPPPVHPSPGNGRTPAPDMARSAPPPVAASLPTAIGVPALDRPAPVPSPAPVSSPAPSPISNPGADEASSIDEASDADVLPMARPFWADLAADVRELRAGRVPETKTRLVVASVVAACAGILLLAGLVRACSGTNDARDLASTTPAASSASSVGEPEGPESPAPTSTPSGAIPPANAASAAPTPAEHPPASAPSSGSSGSPGCVTGGTSRLVASSVRIASGVEVGASPSSLAIAFASSAVDAVAVTVDPSTLSLRSMARARSAHGEIKRVTPLVSGDRFVPVIDADSRRDRLASRRVVPADPPLDVGIEDGAVAVTAHAQSRATKIFALEGTGAHEAVRAVPLAREPGIALAFRRGNAIYVGVAKGEGVSLRAVGSLGKIEGFGQVGVPSIAATDRSVVVAWSDRATRDEPWQIRWTTMDVATGALAGALPVTLALPEGGPGEASMSPALAAMGGDRFVMAWTEGPVANHEVRAMVMNPRGEIIGSPLTLSRPGVNAGQPRVVVGPDGRGAVAFLEETGKSFDLIAAPISCSATVSP